MTDTGIKHFLCDTIEKSLLRSEWTKWLCSLERYLDLEEIQNPVNRRDKLLHLGGPQLQRVANNLPGALTTPDGNTNVYDHLVERLTHYFSPTQNATFKRHVFRSVQLSEGETFYNFLLKLQEQARKWSPGSTPTEATELNVKESLTDASASLELRMKLLIKERSLDGVIQSCTVQEQIVSQSRVMTGDTEQISSSLTIHQIQKGTQSRGGISCWRCGIVGHISNNRSCPARKSKCFKCGRSGHYAMRCWTRQSHKRFFEAVPGAKRDQPPHKRNRSNINVVDTNLESEASTSLRPFDCFNVTGPGSPQRDDDIILCNVGGVPIILLIDSGSKANIITGTDWATLQERHAVMWNTDSSPSQVLRGYAFGQPLPLTHRFQTSVSVPGRQEVLTHFYVVENGDISILGKETAQRLGVLQLGLTIHQLMAVSPFPKIKNVTVKLTIDPDIAPVKQLPRRIPIAVEQQVEQKLKEALAADIIERVTEPSPWVSPIVVIFKPAGDIRICVDMRRANKAILRENYPLPTFDSIMPKLRRATYFTRLDLLNAYNQLELDEESRPITTFITHRGMYRYKRLLFGVNSAPEIFQRVFEELLSPCRNCLKYLDDIIVFGATEEEHDRCLEQVLTIFRENNVCLNDAKCIRKTTQLSFLGHRLSAKGVEVDPAKTAAVEAFRAPQSKEEVLSFLGLVTYVGKFIPDLDATMEPLCRLLRDNEAFKWTTSQQHSFDRLKTSLAKLPTVSHFDPHKRTRLVADASPVALGAVLLQFDADQTPLIISFASKSLSSVERQYSPTEKESLAMVWAVEQFYYYLAGLEFELITDHEPLEDIFKPTSKLPARIERWVLRLQAFKFQVIYQSGKTNIADVVSRLTQLDNSPTFDTGSDAHIHAIFERSTPMALTVTQIIAESIKDVEIVDAVRKLQESSWTGTDKNPYYSVRQELTVMGPALLRGQQIVIPASLRPQVLHLAHEGHLGESVMKRRLRAKVWWPLVDREAEQWVKHCRECLLLSLPVKPSPMSRHKFPDKPSRYCEIEFLRTTTSKVIIDHLQDIFFRLDIPESLRSENELRFSSQEFLEFCRENNMQLIKAPPYWPQANGEVENMNQSKVSHARQVIFQSEVQKFLLMYNGVPHCSIGKCPAQLLLNRPIRDQLPSSANLNSATLDDEKRHHDLLAKHKEKETEDGDTILKRVMLRAHKLDAGFHQEYTVMTRKGDEDTLSIDDGLTRKRHVSYVKKLPASSTSPQTVSLNQDSAKEGDSDSDQEETKIPPLKLKKKEGMWQPE